MHESEERGNTLTKEESKMAKAKKGDLFTCEVCGLVVAVDESCDCAVGELICCDIPMEKGKAKMKKAAKPAKKVFHFKNYYNTAVTSVGELRETFKGQDGGEAEGESGGEAEGESEGETQGKGEEKITGERQTRASLPARKEESYGAARGDC